MLMLRSNRNRLPISGIPGERLESISHRPPRSLVSLSPSHPHTIALSRALINPSPSHHLILSPLYPITLSLPLLPTLLPSHRYPLLHSHPLPFLPYYPLTIASSDALILSPLYPLTPSSTPLLLTLYPSPLHPLTPLPHPLALSPSHPPFLYLPPSHSSPSHPLILHSSLSSRPLIPSPYHSSSEHS